MTLTLTTEISGPNDPSEETQQRPDRRLLVGYLHKTSNTLCGIKGYASLIADREMPEDQAGLWARKIIREVERMEEIFRSVGDLTRGRQNPDTGIDLPKYITQTAITCAESLDAVDVQIGNIPEGELRMPAADLALVLRELLTNCAESAWSYAPEVRVDLKGVVRSGDRLFLEIQDNGCGMNPELREQAPSPFVTTKDNHHGVGLTRMETLMEMYGLQWELHSEEGQGTRVIMEVAEAI